MCTGVLWFRMKLIISHPLFRSPNRDLPLGEGVKASGVASSFEALMKTFWVETSFTTWEWLKFALSHKFERFGPFPSFLAQVFVDCIHLSPSAVSSVFVIPVPPWAVNPSIRDWISLCKGAYASRTFPEAPVSSVRCAASRRWSSALIYAACRAPRPWASVFVLRQSLITFLQAADYSHLQGIVVQRVCPVKTKRADTILTFTSEQTDKVTQGPNKTFLIFASLLIHRWLG